MGEVAALALFLSGWVLAAITMAACSACLYRITTRMLDIGDRLARLMEDDAG